MSKAGPFETYKILLEKITKDPITTAHLLQINEMALKVEEGLKNGESPQELKTVISCMERDLPMIE